MEYCTVAFVDGMQTRAKLVLITRPLIPVRFSLLVLQGCCSPHNHLASLLGGALYTFFASSAVCSAQPIAVYSLLSSGFW
jgi:hypothetical protein